MKTAIALNTLALVLLMGCEDGPTQVFAPAESGSVPTAGGGSWTPNVMDEDGNEADPSKGFGSGNATGGDSVGRARFCDEEESEAQIRAMVAAPIIPDVSVGTVPLLDAEGQPYVVDTLLGRPEDGKFCDPTYIYSDAFIWGPTQEIVVLFDMETRLVTSVIAFQSYLGALQGTVTLNGESVTVSAKPRERLRIDGVELAQYASSSERNELADSYLNEANVTLLYGMVRETFFGADPLPRGFNCVESNLCRIIYTSPTQEAVAQDTFILLEDSGVELRFTPDGHVFFIYGRPVRVAPFEVRTEVDLGDELFQPQLISRSVPNCVLDLNGQTTWSTFETNCLSDERTRARISYNVHQQRDGVTADFNATSVDFLRKTSEHGILSDGSKPGVDDTLYGMTWTLSSAAPVKQFVPATLAAAYKVGLEALLRQSVGPGAAPEHPFLTYEVEIPSDILAQDRGAPIDALRTFDGRSWMQLLREDITALYEELKPYQRDLVDDRVLNPIHLVEPYMVAVLGQLTGQAIHEPEAFLALQSTDDQHWSIGFANFVQNDVAYRVIAQFNLSYDGITAVTIERGYSEIDGLYNGLNSFVRENSGAVGSPYFDLTLADGNYPMNGWGLGKNGMTVTGYDRQLGTIDVSLRAVLANGDFTELDLTVPGDHMDDRSGYLKQLRGERYEFVPAHMVKLYGKETVMAFFIDQAGEIARISQFTFKGDVTLCRGATAADDLTVRYGDDVRRALKSWERRVGEALYRDCELVFNYSPNGNVLDEVVSLKNKVSFWTVSERASTASIWK
jgi:hypothetical protein